jgi:serine/threonine protein kinase
VSQSKPSALPDPTEIAGRYQVEKRLGAGAFGVVYKAKDSMLERDVAIKTIRLEGLAASSTSLDDLLQRFDREARTAAKLKHPNIVTIYDIGNAEGLSYLAMEFIDGVGLDRMVAESGKLPVERAAALTAQVADALDYAWRSQNVIHRDIKPANIMVEAGDRVKVTDFGIAKATDSAEHLTATGSLLGTPSYMSPEQARGAALDGRSDLFSVGCVFYELLAGRKAFRGDSITALLFKIITEEPPPLHEIDPLIPDEAVRIVARALAKAPETRYQSGRELAADLLALSQGYAPTLRQADSPTTPVADHPTLSFDPTAQATVASTPPPPRTAAATAAAPPTRVTGSVAGSPPPPPPLPAPPVVAPRGSAPPVAPAPRSARPAAALARRKGGGAGLLVGLAAVALVFLALVGVGGWWLLHRPGGVGSPDTSAEAPAPTTLPAEASTAGQPGAAAETAPAPPESAPEGSPVPVLGSPGASAPGGASPSAAAAPPPVAASAASVPHQTPSRTAGGSSAPVVPPPPATSAPPAAAPPAAPSDAFLDTMPSEAPDGRAVGRELAQGYNSSHGGGDSGFGTSRALRRRPLFPRHAPAERPAVAGLRWILVAENGHHRQTGRYGTLAELVRSGDLPLQQRLAGGALERNGYRFTVTVAGDSFRADARPLSPGPRAFYVDDSGFVLVADE